MKSDERPKFYFNNCGGRDYRAIYKDDPDAFYDLETTGRQKNLATTLSPGEKCIVAAPDMKGLWKGPVRDRPIQFTWFKFEREEIRPDENKKSQRVFCGTKLQSDTLSQGDAAKDVRYRIFFRRNGNFKRRSALQC